MVEELGQPATRWTDIILKCRNKDEKGMTTLTEDHSTDMFVASQHIMTL